VKAIGILYAGGYTRGRKNRWVTREMQRPVHQWDNIRGGVFQLQGLWIPVERARELSEEVGLAGPIAGLLF
jgi:hypothetical protein